MKDRKTRMALAVMLLISLLVPLGATAYAADGYEPLEVELEYIHKYTTNDTSVDSLFHYIIEVTGEACALPTEADADGVFTFQGVSGAGEAKGEDRFFALPGTLHFVFTAPGEYSFRIYADLDTDRQKTNASNYEFEKRVFTVNFYIGDEDGTLKTLAMTAENGNDEKPNEVELDPSYHSQPTPTPAPAPSPAPKPGQGLTPKTGDESSPAAYAALLVLSVALAAAAFRLEKKHRFEK